MLNNTKLKLLQLGSNVFATFACMIVWSAHAQQSVGSAGYSAEASQNIRIETARTDAQSMSSMSLTAQPQSLSMTPTSTLGCLVAHLEQDAKTPLVMIPFDEDLMIPVGGAFNVSWLPPSPSNADQTIAGVDSDGDCVRDDIERYITNIYSKKSDYLVRENLFRYAIWMNQFLNLSPVLTEIRAKTAITNMRIAGQCVKNILGTTAGEGVLSNLFAQFHNTWARSDRYVFNMVNYISGWTTRETPFITCN